MSRHFTPRFAAKPFTAGTQQSRYDEITAVLEDSVAKHMRADVTVGAFLSGGIDSTAIAALAMRHNPRLITFTTGLEREGFSEVDVAVASAEAIGARHVTKVVSQAEFVSALPEIVWYLDEPVADDKAAGSTAALTREITALQQRQNNLVAELEQFEPSGNDEFDKAWRSGIQHRFRVILAVDPVQPDSLSGRRLRQRWDRDRRNNCSSHPRVMPP